MGDQEGRDAGRAQLGGQLVAHEAPGVSVERGQRLVEQQRARTPGQRPRERHALALAAAESCRALVRQVRDAQPVEQRRHVARRRARERHVALDRQMRKEGMVLRHVADRSPLGRQVDVPVLEPRLAPAGDPAAVGPAQAGDAAQDGRLPRARRTRQGDDLVAGRQAQVDVEAAKPAGDVKLERRHPPISLYETSTPALRASSTTPSARATSMSTSSCW